jgi:hypothetical protein
MLVIASIHQPSTNTLLLFDNVLLLSSGKTVYYGPPANSMRYFISLGHPPPPLLSPAEFMLELANTNFTSAGRFSIVDRVALLCKAWDDSLERKILLDKVVPRDGEEEVDLQIRRGADTSQLMKPFILLHRMAIVISPPSHVPPRRLIYLEIVPRPPCLRSSSCHVSRTCDPHGDRLATTLLLRDKHSKCLEFFIFRFRVYELYGTNL